MQSQYLKYNISHGKLKFKFNETEIKLSIDFKF